MRLTRARFGLLVATIVVAIFWGRVREDVAVDKCLDNGGSWNYGIGRCEPAPNPPLPAPREGPPTVRAWSEWSAVIAVAAVLGVFVWRDRPSGSRPDV